MTKTKSEEVEALNSEREYLRGFRDGQELERKVTKADWLRSEIEKLEGMIDKADYTSPGWPIETEVEKDGYNTAITSIITRYKEELKVLTGE